MKNRYFYNDIQTNTLAEIKTDINFVPENLNFIKTNAWTNEKFLWAKDSNNWEKIIAIDSSENEKSIAKIKTDNGEVSVSGYFSEFPFLQTKTDFNVKSIENWNKIHENKKLINKTTASEYENYVNININYTKFLVEKEFLKGKNGLFKDLFFVDFTSDYENFTFKIQYYLFNREKNFSDNPINYKKYFVLYDLKNNSVTSDLGGVELFSEELSGFYSFYNKLPAAIIREAKSDYELLINHWAKKNLTFCCLQKGLKTMEALTAFPYCPNLYFIKNHFLLKDINIDSNDPEIFNNLCKKIKIPNFKFLRKKFITNPEVLIDCKILINFGFNNIDYISKLLENGSFSNFSNSDYQNLLFYEKKLRRHGSKESKRFNQLIKFQNDKDFYFTDGIEMFHSYYRNIPLKLKFQIYREGMTKYYHDALSKLTTQIREPKIKFKYSEIEKKLEDSIDGFDFILPKNNYELIDVGLELNNCVGSYGKKVQNRECLVVYAKRNNIIEICIEIRENKIHQKRGAYNSDLTGDAALVMEKYQEKHALIFERNSY